MLQNREEVLEDLKSKLQDYEGGNGDFDSFFQEVYNDDPDNIYTSQAKEDTESFENDEDMDGYTTMLDGVWGAIDLVKQYETDELGQMQTKIEPCAIANMVDYIRASSVLYDVLEDAELDMNDDLSSENCEKVYKVIDEDLENQLHLELRQNSQEFLANLQLSTYGSNNKKRAIKPFLFCK